MTSIDLQNGQDSNGAGGNQSGVVQINGGSEQRITNGYSINGILGIQHSNDPNVNTMKRKRVEDHGKDLNHNSCARDPGPLPLTLKKNRYIATTPDFSSSSHSLICNEFSLFFQPTHDKH